MYKRRVWLFLFFSVCIGIPYNRHVFAHDKCWSVKAIVEKSEIIAIVTVNKLQRSHDFINIGFSVGETYKGDTDRLNSFIMPTVPKGTFRSPKMLSFLIGKRYLVFLKYSDPSCSLESLRLISDTSGAVLLEGDEIIRKPALLDGWPARHTSFDEARLIQRIQEELMSDGQWPLNIDKKRALEARGYHSNTTEQIIEATKSDSYYVRKMALELLTERIGIDAIGKLKAALDDSALLVRCTAAHLLATFGDRSGLAQMQRDFVELAPELEQAMINDPSFNKDWANIKVRNKTFSIEDGLEVSKVLAELGDPSGYELAETALKGFSRGLRLRAINILVEIAKTQEAGCSVRVLDPISILTKVAASEKEEDVILALFNLTTMRLKSSTAARVLEAAMNAPDQTEHVRQVAQKFLDELACSTQLSNN